MLRADPFSELVSARVLEFAGDFARWQRRLWNIGATAGLLEASEALEAHGQGILIDRAAREACISAAKKVKGDPGIGGSNRVGTLLGALHSPLRAQSHAHEIIQEFADELPRKYLGRWADALEPSGHGFGAERVARALASHVLDLDFSPASLHSWWRARTNDDGDEYSLSDIIRLLEERVREPRQRFTVLVILERAPQTLDHPDWLAPSAVAPWLLEHGFGDRALGGTSYAGGLALNVQARDEVSAVGVAGETIEGIQAQAMLGSGRRVEPHPRAWVKGRLKPVPLRRRRLVNVQPLSTRAVSAASGERGDVAALGSALELLSHLDLATAPVAVAAGWVAVESVLKAPADDGAHLAADRLAAIVACSYVRSELTSLAWACIREGTVHASDLSGWPSNVERARQVASLLAQEASLGLQDRRDHASELCMREAAVDPVEGLAIICGHLNDTFRRLYRQRNLVMHGGLTNAVALRPTLRVAAPLVGAGFDSIVHYFNTRSTRPRRLAAKAAIGIESLKDPGPHDLVRLLTDGTSDEGSDDESPRSQPPTSSCRLGSRS